MERETETEIKCFIKEKNGNVKSLPKTASLAQKFRKKLQNTGQHDNSPQVSDFHFHISTLILRVLSAQTGVPALFKMLNSQKHPGTNCQGQQLENK